MGRPPVRIAAIAACAVPYQVPIYRRLADDRRVELTVLYGSTAVARDYRDVGFGNRWVEGDPSLLEGYHYEFLGGADRCAPDRGFFALTNPDVYQVIRRGDYDVVWLHGYSHLTNWIAILAARLEHLPILIREEQTLLHSRHPLKAVPRAIVLRLLLRQAYGLYIGRNNRAFFRHYGISDDRLFWVPYCVDNAALQRDAGELRVHRTELRGRYGIDADLPVIVFVGRLVPKKGADLLLEAFRQVRSRHRCALLVAGDGVMREALQQQAEGIPDVHWLGLETGRRLAEVYAAADIFVLPSRRHETWGLVVNEAMNFGLPIVVSDAVGSAADLVEDGQNGHVVAAGDVSALAAALTDLVSDPSKRSRFGERSRALVDAFHYQQAADGVAEASEHARAHSHRQP